VLGGRTRETAARADVCDCSVLWPRIVEGNHVAGGERQALAQPNSQPMFTSQQKVSYKGTESMQSCFSQRKMLASCVSWAQYLCIISSVISCISLWILKWFRVILVFPLTHITFSLWRSVFQCFCYDVAGITQKLQRLTPALHNSCARYCWEFPLFTQQIWFPLHVFQYTIVSSQMSTG